MNTLEAVKFQTKTQHVDWFWLPLCSNPFCSRGFGVGFGYLKTKGVFGALELMHVF